MFAYFVTLCNINNVSDVTLFYNYTILGELNRVHTFDNVFDLIGL